ncbi:MAG: peptide chain release factor 1 [Nitrospirae bacterium GWC2_57_13]|jgi:peptide chain release factor 1|nr:MAG: peptide chain release factor 1 [Nitrospirae bacterium GWC1_57_7]OGW26359.1 MAG: peptide chain release factor 1 [Nitrospirae bacterium GWC2_57_13]OGW44312.1 MAG: peptide chain release factor 1 [Nitrospirae bacterium GWD2_57_8]HAR46953.1 peptide chain release factor 1 [Nitrospiraceae bacterium]
MLSKLEAVSEKYDELTRLLSDPAVAADHQQYHKFSRERSDIEDVVTHYRAYRDVLRQIAEAEEIIRDKQADPELREMADAELKQLQPQSGRMEQDLRLMLVPKDPRDDRNVFLEIRAGAGGDEAGLFAADLFRMYSRYAEKQRWKLTVLDMSTSGVGGIREVIAQITGKGVFSRLKYESGVHRVQRVPTTEASGRIHTSTITVAVMPEADDVDVQIEAKDLRIDTFCSSGAGGQSVNTTYSAVRITYLPTNEVVSCQDERSQTKNREKAMKVLRSRLLEKERAKHDAEIAQERKSQVGTGERSEKIRTYNFPQSRVTDHRIGLSLYRLDSVLDGDLDEFINGLAAADNAERLKNL